MGLVKFGDYVKEVKINIDRNNNPYEYYVAGDHMDSEDLTIRRKGLFATDDVGPAFTRLFKTGQILYGSRRTYLKKVAVADFEGICSNTTFVLETKDENKLRQRLLPFIMLTDDFTKWSISKSKGSTNPYILFSDLANYEFELPDINKQDELVKLLWQAYATKESYREMIRATDEMVKSQFIEMFGDTFQNERGWTYKKLPEVSTIVLGSTPSSSNAAFWDGDVKWITPAELSDDSFYLYDSERHITEEGVKSTSLKPFPAGTVILSTRAPIGKTAIAGCEMYCNQGFKNFVCDNTINPVYLFYSLRIHNPELQKMGTGSTFLELSKKAIEQISISVPPKELQDEFEQFYKQADKSKFELKQAIEKIDKVMRALMQ